MENQQLLVKNNPLDGKMPYLADRQAVRLRLGVSLVREATVILILQRVLNVLLKLIILGNAKGNFVLRLT